MLKKIKHEFMALRYIKHISQRSSKFIFGYIFPSFRCLLQHLECPPAHLSDFRHSASQNELHAASIWFTAAIEWARSWVTLPYFSRSHASVIYHINRIMIIYRLVCCSPLPPPRSLHNLTPLECTKWWITVTKYTSPKTFNFNWSLISHLTSYVIRTRKAQNSSLSLMVWFGFMINNAL